MWGKCILIGLFRKEHILPGLLFNQGNKFPNKIFQPINVNNAVLNNTLGAKDREIKQIEV